jgi:hypothetical protein
MPEKINIEQLRLLDEKQVAEILHTSVRTLRKRRLIGGGPPFIRLNRNIRYRLGDLAAYLDSRPRGGD